MISYQATCAVSLLCIVSIIDLLLPVCLLNVRIDEISANECAWFKSQLLPVSAFFIKITSND